MAFLAADEIGMMMAASTVSRIRWSVLLVAAGWIFSTSTVRTSCSAESKGNGQGLSGEVRRPEVR